MKRCPKCGQTYTDQDINFCLNDGELLSFSQSAYRSPFDDRPSGNVDDSPPTMVLDQARITNPTGWNPPASPPAVWQQAQPQPVYPYAVQTSPNMVLGIVSLCLGLASITIGWCCYSGLLLAPAAMIAGFIALIQNRSDPQQYGGKGLAIGGIASGFAYFVFLVIFILIYGLALIGGSIS